ncbi:biotin/lipoyl-binding protein [Flexivirga sp. ID2601S]|uniref:Biotin/lipoyl-binding protein n=1 Tax=Flexivirga aerilata TaxID=1656889 RepID=A0A849AFK7_9MICO|nr:biotin carboxylase N-terminal domain-containing protein [Flexivirga aerilata]NNG37978.1 biotin/lipoyl-binding protein [Flexivirga aerilata]
MTIRRLLVANRGEIARRVFATCRQLGIETVAVHSDADADAPFVREADYAVRLPGDAPSDTYLRGDLIVAAAKSSGADAIHPGYGFLSENAEFAGQVIDAGVTWVGPRPETIASMGSKIEAKSLMRAGGVPTLDVDVDNVADDAFPLLVKAAFGGGGRGMRVVQSRDRLAGELEAARDEAKSAFGDDTVFVEPYLPTARHVEVQVLADEHGTCWVVGERDCSIQRRHQKVVEEAPAPNLSESVRDRLFDAARKAVAAVDYVGAGTVEFLVQGDSVYFLEMNTRLQVEHPVTECVTGTDLVAGQLTVAEGGALPERDFTPNGHAIEVRLYAEDPAHGWAPQTGVVESFEFPAAIAEFAKLDRPGLRLDSAVESGSTVSIHYDPMLAKVIVWGPTREAATRMLSDALRRGRVHGVLTNAAVLRSIMTDEEFVAGRVHTSLLDERIEQWIEAAGAPDTTQAVTAAALADATAAQRSRPVQQRIPAAWRNVPSQDQTRTYLHGDDEVTVAYRSVGGRLTPADQTLAAEQVDADGVRLRSGEVVSAYRVDRAEDVTFVDGPHGAIDLTLEPRFVDPQEAVASGSLLAPMPGVVTAVSAAVGDSVTAGAPLLVLEAMKMQHSITAPADGVVSELPVSVGTQVTAGAVLAVIDENDSAE